MTGLGAKIEDNLPTTQPPWYGKSALCVLLGLTILRLWIPPLSSSLWVDETGTFWMASGSLAQTISKCLHWPGQSPLYGALVWAAMKLGGQSEVVMRLPSVAAMALTAFLLYRLGVRILDRQAALLATLVFVALHDVAFAAADARPYACALLATVASTLLLVRWLESRRFADWFRYVLLAALVVHLHYFFSLIFAVHLIYAIAWHRTRRPVNWLWLLAAAVVVGLLILPLAGHLRLLGASRSSMSYRDTPDPLKLFQALTPSAVAFGLAAGLLLSYLFSQGFALRPLEANPSSVALIVSWLAVAPVLLFVVSFLTPTKIFVPRYYLSASPGLALLTGWAIRAFFPGRAQLIAALAVTLALIAAFGQLRHLRFPHSHDDWRAAMQIVRSVARDSEMPVLVRSTLLESTFMDWQANPTVGNYLYAPLYRYRPAGRVLPLPFDFDEKARRYLEEISSSLLERTNQFLFVSYEGDLKYRGWLEGRLGGAGFRQQPIEGAGAISVILFKR